MERWIALDIETTGLSPTRDEIREVAAIPFGCGASHAEHVLRFTPSDLRPSVRPPARARLGELLDTIGEGSALVAHNAAFDLAFLGETLRRAGIRNYVLRAYCTLRLARAVVPDLERYDLASLRETLHLKGRVSHVALDDARVVAALFGALMQRAALMDEEAIRALHGSFLQVGSRCASTGARR